MKCPRDGTIRMALISVGIALLAVVFWPSEEAVTESEDYYEQSYTIEVEPNYEASLIQAVRNRDEYAGRIAAENTAYDYDDLLWLSKIMAAESGPNWPDAFVMMIGEVVLNRVESPEWPNIVIDVLTDTNGGVQYAPVYGGTWDEIIPTEHQISLAMRLLDGERVLEDVDVVFQALQEQGDITVATYYDEDLNTTTYFCKEEN